MVVGGRVLATGTHAALMVRDPAYAALVRRGETPASLTDDDDVAT